MAQQKPAENKTPKRPGAAGTVNSPQNVSRGRTPTTAKTVTPVRGQGKIASSLPTPVPAKTGYTVKPEFWDSLLDLIPPWGDEIAAILLIIFGLVSFLSLLNVSVASDATISAAWSQALISLFGYGSAIVSAGVLSLGLILLLPKIGVIVRFPVRRILALEFTFLSLLALLHLGVGDTELRAIARLGRGGGQIGWALSAFVTSLLGASIAILIFSAIFVLSLAVVVGIKRTQITGLSSELSTALRTWGETRLPQRPQAAPMVSALDEALATPVSIADEVGTPVLVMPTAAQAQRIKTHSIMRVRIDPDHLPPSMRPGASTPTEEAPFPAASMPLIIAGGAPANVPGRREGESNRMPNFNSIGTVKGKAGKGGGPLMVERPDGRLKRYFTVAGMKEPRQTLKRDTALPPVSLMRDVEINLPDEQEINNNVVLIENTLLEFDIDVDVVDVKVGPTVTQYAVQPFSEAPGSESAFSRTRISKIASLANDLALSLSAKRLRLETPVPGHSYIGIEVPNKKPSMVALRSVLESKHYAEQAAKKKSPLFVPLGRDVAGVPVGIDLSQMPHLLIAGTTGSGKSVCIAALAAAIILENTPDKVRMVMLDPKMVELSRFNGIPHLLGPVETDPERIIGVLRWCTREMDRRYKMLEENAVRNIDLYNERLGRRRKEEYLPYIVVFVDEIGDLMMSHPDETEATVARLAQMARAVGIHLVVATQRPSVDVITGLIKANFPSRIAFAVASGTDSRVILDSVGAETLMGRGDMLYLSADSAAPKRLQGCFISDDEVRAITQFWKDWTASQPEKEGTARSTMGPWERGLTRREFLSETDPMLEQAIELVIAEKEASASLIQRRLGLGYPRAARIMDLLAEIGIIGEVKEGGRSREVLVKPGKDPFKDLIERRMNETKE